jgi:hypothetical protein
MEPAAVSEAGGTLTCVVHIGSEPSLESTVPAAPIGSRLEVVALRVTRSPRAVIGDSASNAEDGDVAPVPPAVTGLGAFRSARRSSRKVLWETELIGVFGTAYVPAGHAIVPAPFLGMLVPSFLQQVVLSRLPVE